VGAYLLDVNVLIALSWPSHVASARVEEWFRQASRAGWATCPFTETGFVRLISNPRFSPQSLTVQQAVELLLKNTADSRHRFWPGEIAFSRSLELVGGKLQGHRQVTDAYLLGVAIHHKGKLATLDRAVLALLPDSRRRREFIELI
jgi:uncharacterized protein